MQNDNDPESQRNRVNCYRVLLTRARRSMIIVVPPPPNERIKGCAGLAARFDDLFNHLLQAGASLLPE